MLLALMQAALSRCAGTWRVEAPPLAGAPRVLVAALRGEAHLLPAILLRHAWQLAGWSATTIFPDSMAALAQHVGAARPETVCLATSDVFRRDHRLSDLARGVAMARGAGGPAIRVAVSGRLCRQVDRVAERVGADVAFAGSVLPASLARSAGSPSAARSTARGGRAMCC